MDLYQQLTRCYRNDDRVVLETPAGDRWPLSRLERLAVQLSQHLSSQGLVAGERVLVQVAKSPQTIALYLACLRSGLVFVPLNTAYTPEELDYFVQDADPSLLVLDHTSSGPFRQRCPVLMMEPGMAGSVFSEVHESDAQTRTYHPPASSRVAPENAASIIYTSGTTGRSKGAVLTRSNLLANARALNRLWRFTSADVLLHCLPVFHVHGLFIALHTAMLSGARIYFLPTFDADAVMKALPRCTVMMGVPTYYSRLLARPEPDRAMCANVRLFVSGSAPLSNETFAEFEARTGHRILERYGMSETNIITSNTLDAERVPGTVGFALEDTTVRIASEQDRALPHDEVGSVQVRGPGVFHGYWRRPEVTRKEFTDDGYFRTGDLGRIDRMGRLTLVGRHKDLIISGGLNVYPAEIERLLNTGPGVVESAVVGVPDPDFGERVEAFIVSDGTIEGLPEVLQEWVLRHLANFKRPKAFHLIESLPRNTMEKFRRTRSASDSGRAGKAVEHRNPG